MSGVFGVVSKDNCRKLLFYGVDYHSHLGTQRGGLAVFDKEEKKIHRKIHDITQSQFKSKFFDDYKDMHGNFKSTSSLDTNDIPKAILALKKAYEFLTIKGHKIEKAEFEQPQIIKAQPQIP